MHCLSTHLVSRRTLWMLLCRLLLGRDARTLWAWHEQPAMDGRCDRSHRGRKDCAASPRPGSVACGRVLLVCAAVVFVLCWIICKCKLTDITGFHKTSRK